MKRFSGWWNFILLCFGQLVSGIGTSMTVFALTIWVWQSTGKALNMALIGLCLITPGIIVSPFAGVLVDRYSRRLMLLLSNCVNLTSTIIILLLYSKGYLHIWHLYIICSISSIFGALRYPAFFATISLLVKKDDYARASGISSLTSSISAIAGPVLAGILMGTINISGIMIIDIISYFFVILSIAWVHIPKPGISTEGKKARNSFIKESIWGFHYIVKRPSLLGIQLLLFTTNIIFFFSLTLQAPMILARTANNAVILGIVRSIAGVGGLAGGLLISLWGGPKNKVNGLLAGLIFTSILGVMMTGLGQTQYFWFIGSFFVAFFYPIIGGSNNAIWQAKVPPDIQGRVFAIRSMIATISTPIALLLVGPLADNIFEPMMKYNENMKYLFSWIVGASAGSGMSLMFIISGILGAIVGIIGYNTRIIRKIDDILPDHDAVVEPIAPKN